MQGTGQLSCSMKAIGMSLAMSYVRMMLRPFHMESHYEDDDHDVNPKLPAANKSSVTKIRIYSLNEEILEN